jgi:hypothetical protein
MVNFTPALRMAAITHYDHIPLSTVSLRAETAEVERELKALELSQYLKGEATSSKEELREQVAALERALAEERRLLHAEAAAPLAIVPNPTTAQRQDVQ